MATVTQKFLAVFRAPWIADGRVQTKLASVTFDDGTPITIAQVRAEVTRMSVFKDEDTTTTGDTWTGSPPLEAIEKDNLELLALYEIPAAGFGLYPPFNLVGHPTNDTYTYGDHDFADEIAVFTIDGDNYLAGNITTTDQTPAVVASGLGDSDKLHIYEAGVRIASFTANSSGAIAGDMPSLTVAAHTVYAVVEQADGSSQTLPLSRTITVS